MSALSGPVGHKNFHKTKRAGHVPTLLDLIVRGVIALSTGARIRGVTTGIKVFDSTPTIYPASKDTAS